MYLYFRSTYIRSCYISKSCSTIGTTKTCSFPSLFHCSQSLKCISKHRLSDGSNDCYYGEDESFSACQINDSKRFICSSEPNKCLSIVALENRKTDCLDGEDELTYDERNAFQGLIPFGFICNCYYDFLSMKNLVALEKTVHSMNMNVTMNI
ncbi:unnamed protein product [Adineta steineri]|uniref:Uncharacterized protein n=1 Tax=Adineta steineri TaxID=433720 RepID=A0A815LNK8_9BILA|nr:unnamed protein product [Adineta steineri]CAF1405614.1 unnamed protein product [Adineta steineri]CAF1439785.1 unnamed protein product [Adineta steineri]CAF3864278.1 unnamed protein product [Adineta steineri]CAF3898788.1 unnamed protein product [Adineta steineri]